GTAAGAIANGARAAGFRVVSEVADPTQAAAAIGNLPPGSAVLFKASRAERLERAVRAFQTTLAAHRRAAA
ncbi:MAG: hypothetical protein JKY65_03405, partial [Planctomycetes bacterium]|nr:hypothetical protein [Planctomycetota bacterium]